MIKSQKERGLKYFFYVFGLVNIFVLPIMIIDIFGLPVLPAEQFFWAPRNAPYELMIGSIYGALGIMMILAAKEPIKHKLFVDFVVLGNFAHAVEMIVFGIIEQPAHLYGDAIWISIMWVLPLIFYPWGLSSFLREAKINKGNTM